MQLTMKNIPGFESNGLFRYIEDFPAIYENGEIVSVKMDEIDGLGIMHIQCKNLTYRDVTITEFCLSEDRGDVILLLSEEEDYVTSYFDVELAGQHNSSKNGREILEIVSKRCKDADMEDE